MTWCCTPSWALWGCVCFLCLLGNKKAASLLYFILGSLFVLLPKRQNKDVLDFSLLNKRKRAVENSRWAQRAAAEENCGARSAMTALKARIHLQAMGFPPHSWTSLFIQPVETTQQRGEEERRKNTRPIGIIRWVSEPYWIYVFIVFWPDNYMKPSKENREKKINHIGLVQTVSCLELDQHACWIFFFLLLFF